MNQQLKQAFKDIVPSLSDPIPVRLFTLVESMYSLSLQRKRSLPNRSEIARYHICTYVAVEKYQNAYKLPPPETFRIPVQPKLLYKLLDEFRDFLDDLSTPMSSPKRQRSKPTKLNNPSTPAFHSKNRMISPVSIGKECTQSKKFYSMANENASPKRKRSTNSLPDIASPFNFKEVNTPKVSSSETRDYSPATSTIYKYDKKHISIPDFISFANNFFIPASTTSQMLSSFIEKRHKFHKKSEWLLACGLIYAAYTRINYQLLENKLGAKSQFLDHLLQYQKGGLVKWNMLLWCNMVENSVQQELWIKDLEQKFIHGNLYVNDDSIDKEIRARLGTEFEILDHIGSMVNGNTNFESVHQVNYFNNWTTKVLKDF